MASGSSLVAEKHWPQMELEFRCGLVRRVWSDLVWFADPWCPDTLQTCLTGRTQGLGRCVCNQIVCSASAAQVSWNGSATDLPQPQPDVAAAGHADPGTKRLLGTWMLPPNENAGVRHNVKSKTPILVGFPMGRGLTASLTCRHLKRSASFCLKRPGFPSSVSAERSELSPILLALNPRPHQRCL
jgi:hypothetical protein